MLAATLAVEVLLTHAHGCVVSGGAGDADTCFLPTSLVQCTSSVAKKLHSNVLTHEGGGCSSMVYVWYIYGIYIWYIYGM